MTPILFSSVVLYLLQPSAAAASSQPAPAAAAAAAQPPVAAAPPAASQAAPAPAPAPPAAPPAAAAAAADSAVPAASLASQPAAAAATAQGGDGGAGGASGDVSLYGEAASTLVAGSHLESTVNQILEMGGGSWEREQVIRALRAAFNNPERAVEYLYTVSARRHCLWLLHTLQQMVDSEGFEVHMCPVANVVLKRRTSSGHIIYSLAPSSAPPTQ